MKRPSCQRLRASIQVEPHPPIPVQCRRTIITIPYSASVTVCSNLYTLFTARRLQGQSCHDRSRRLLAVSIMKPIKLRWNRRKIEKRRKNTCFPFKLNSVGKRHEHLIQTTDPLFNPQSCVCVEHHPCPTLLKKKICST
jgi:hypothetical protein